MIFYVVLTTKKCTFALLNFVHRNSARSHQYRFTFRTLKRQRLQIVMKKNMKSLEIDYIIVQF